ncbi:MAG: P-II family nitrogen regulator [Nitrososphaerales archaeon]
MKKIEAMVAPEVFPRVSDALKKIGVGGFTCFDTKGIGQRPIREMHGARGTGTYTPEFNTNCSLLVVVKDSDVDKVIQAIVNTTSTGMNGEGKIFVSNVEEAIDIGSKKRGDSVL